MAKQQNIPTVPDGDNHAALARLLLKHSEIEQQRIDIVRQIAKVENVNRAGVPAVLAIEPPDETKDDTAAAYELLNGASIEAMPQRNMIDGVRLHELQKAHTRRVMALKILAGQILRATIAAAHESAAINVDQTRELNRQRALLLVSLLEINSKIEAHRLQIAVNGVSAGTPFDGFTNRLFGAGVGPSPFNHWPRRYLDACLAAGVITKKDLNT